MADDDLPLLDPPEGFQLIGEKLPSEFQPYKFFPLPRQNHAPLQGGRPLGVGRGTADPEFRKYMMNSPSFNQLRARTGLNFPEMMQPDEEGRLSTPLTPQLLDTLQKSGDFQKMLPYLPKPKPPSPEEMEKIPMSQNEGGGWKQQLDALMGQQVQDTDTQNQNQGMTWRKMLDQLNPIGTAAAQDINPDREWPLAPFEREPDPNAPRLRPDMMDDQGNYQPYPPGFLEPKVGPHGRPLGEGEQEIPYGREDFKKQFGRDPMTDTEVEWYSGTDNPSGDFNPTYRRRPEGFRPGWNVRPDRLRPDRPNPPIGPMSQNQRGVLDWLNPIGTAEARTAKKNNPNNTPMDDWPATPEEFQQKYGRPPQTDIERKFYSDEGPPPLKTDEQVDRSITAAGRTPRPEQPGNADRGWFANTISAIDRMGGQAAQGFRQRVEQAEKEGEGKSFRERAQAYNRAFDPGLEAGIQSGPQVGVGQATKDVFHENVESMGQHWDYLKNNLGADWLKHPYYNSLAALGNAAMVGLGPVGMGLSPVQGTYRSIVAQPAENAMGLPKWVTEGAMLLATPGIGIPRAGGMVSGLTSQAAGAVGRGVQQLPGIKQGKELIQSSFFPQTMAGGEEFRGAWQSAMGTAAQATEKNFDSFRKYYPELINAPRDFAADGKPTLKDPQVNFMNWIDGGPSATRPEGNLGKLADMMKPAFEQVKEDAKSVDRWAEQHWRNEFFPHYWTDPNAARGLSSTFTEGAGAAGHLKERVHNWLEDGIKAGLTPKYEPIEAGMRYLTDMRRLIATEKVLDGAREAGIVTEKSAPGLLRLNNLGPGREGTLWAPEGWAHSWNNVTSRGIGALGEGAANFADYMRRYTNFSTQMMMGFVNNFHALTIGESGWAMESSRAMNKIWGDRGIDNLKGLVRLMASPTAAVQYAVKGKMFKDAYLAKDTFWSRFLSPETVQMIHDLGPEAGMRFAGTRHTSDWQSSQLGDIYTRFKRAAGEFPGSLKPGNLMRGIDYAAPIVGRASQERFKGLSWGQMPGMAAKVVASDIAASMQATQHWLMEVGVPLVKSGALGEHMQDFLRANPGATKEQTLKAFRDIGDFVDHRMGEAVQDNIYWSKWIKQLAQILMVSYSWNRGVVNVIGGGMNDQVNRAMGKGGSAPWTPKDHYLMMTIMNSSIMNAVYQKLKTGTWPQETRDLLGGWSGGTKYEQSMEQSESGKEKMGPWVPHKQRIQMPGIFPKEFAGLAEHGAGELTYKLNPGAGLIGDIAGTKIDSNWVGNVWNAIVDRMTPIGYKNLTEEQHAGSKFGKLEGLMSAREAKPIISNPDYIRRKQYIEEHFPPMNASRMPTIKESQRIREEYIKAHPGVQAFTTKDAKAWWDKIGSKQKSYGGPQ